MARRREEDASPRMAVVVAMPLAAAWMPHMAETAVPMMRDAVGLPWVARAGGRCLEGCPGPWGTTGWVLRAAVP